MPTKFFDLHLEVGATDAGQFYAETILGNNALIFIGTGITPSAAITDLSIQLDSAGVYGLLTSTPTLSQWPMGVNKPRPAAAVPTSKPATVPKPATTPKPHSFKDLGKKKKAAPVLHRPVDLSSIDFPSCKPKCQSFDLFGTGKCKAICQTKKGV